MSSRQRYEFDYNDFKGHSERLLVPGSLRGYRSWIKYDDMLWPLNAWNATGLFEINLGCLSICCRTSMFDRPINQPRAQPWIPGLRLMAKCDPHLRILGHSHMTTHPSVDPIPSMRCSCGYYASYGTESWDADGNFVRTEFCPRVVRGTIKATGFMVLGTKGFRAQSVEVEAIWDQGGGNKRLAARYQVPLFTSKAKLLAEFPPSNVDELLRSPAPS